MATINWPTAIRVGPVDIGIEWDVQITVYRNGRVTTHGLPGARWVASIRFAADVERGNSMRPRIEALITSLRGGANVLSMPHWGRSRPNGTLTSNPTVASGISAGASTFTMANANGTLKAGDIIGLPGQIVMVEEDATPTFGNLTVKVNPPIRAAHNSGTPVTWNKPTTLWIPRNAVSGPFPYLPARERPAFSIDLVEAP